MKFNQGRETSSQTKGFTLIELLTAMSITVVLLSMVSYMTSVAMDGYKVSREKVMGARNAKDAMDAISRDFEGMVLRSADNSNDTSEWLYVGPTEDFDNDKQLISGFKGPTGKEFTERSQVIFFTAAPDRYDGNIGGNNDAGGDISAVSYRLAYRDQISDKNPAQTGAYPVFTLYRHLVNPDEAFNGRKDSDGTNLSSRKLIGRTDLRGAWKEGAPSDDPRPYVADDLLASNVIAENIYELTLTFFITVSLENTSDPTVTMSYPLRVSVRPSAHNLSATNNIDVLRVASDGISCSGYIQMPFGQKFNASNLLPSNELAFTSAPLGGYKINPDILRKGKVTGVEIGMTVLSDRGVSMTSRGGMSRAEIIEEYGYHYTRVVNVPRY